MTPVAPRVARTFTFTTRLSQFAEIAAYSFRQVALSWGGVVLVLISMLFVGITPQALNHFGVPILPTTAEMIAFVGNEGEILWLILPLLTTFYAGELVWREREVGLSEISDASPVPELTRLLGKLTGLALVFAAYRLLMMVGGMLVQAQLGYFDFEVGLYARALFGLQLPEQLLFAVLAFAVHAIVNQKYAGHMVLIVAYVVMAFGAELGVGHNLLIYGSDPGVSYSDISGFSPYMGAWLWFKLYWAAWAMVLAVVARLFWVRGRADTLAARLQSARARLTRPTLAVSATATALIVALGGFIFYNTNVLNAYETADVGTARRAEYERRYAKFSEAPQPRLTGTTLHVEIHPERREVGIRGSYALVNATGVAIDSIHLEPEAAVETGAADFDREATLALDDAAHRHRIYVLRSPLLPGDSLRLGFTVRFAPRGFTNVAADPSVVGNGTHIDARDWLPAIGYQPARELTGAGERRAHGLAPRAPLLRLEDSAVPHDMRGAERIMVEATIGTAAGQLALAPGALVRSWSDGGRRYFHYRTDVPIRNDFSLYSAEYAVHEARWRPSPNDSAGEVTIQIVHHPTHGRNLDHLVRSVQRSLDYFTRHFTPYPHRQVRLVEHPSRGGTLHASAVNISYGERFALFDAESDPRDLDFPFAVVAHEMAHQWWGHQLMPANMEGAALLSESLAWYSALAVVEAEYGREHGERLLAMLREAYLSPRSRAAPPLLRADDWFLGYRKGPFAMHALRGYVGAERVDLALRGLLEEFGAGKAPLATSLDLYRQLQSVTPDSLQYLLVDLFERNAYWELETKRVTAEEAIEGTWRVSLDVEAHKVTVDTAGAPTEMLMNDLVEVGVYGTGEEPLYLRMHRIRAGEQRITVTVPRAPVRAGLDPRRLLIDVEPGDNTREVEGAKAPGRRGDGS